MKPRTKRKGARKDIMRSIFDESMTTQNFPCETQVKSVDHGLREKVFARKKRMTHVPRV